MLETQRCYNVVSMSTYLSGMVSTHMQQQQLERKYLMSPHNL